MAKSKSTTRAARDLFFKYDGSTFYMSRDGADREYKSYAVPLDLERKWLRELTARHLAALVKPGNWWTLNFLVHHRDTNHLELAIATPPLGELWQRTAYLELLLEYVSACQSAGASRARIATALDVVRKHAVDLITRTRSETSRARVAKVLVEAERRSERLHQYLSRHEET
jgi:hypothetical protein